MFRFFLRLIKKEHLLLSRYERTHPHFFWYAGIDALLSVALVFGGFQVAQAGSSWKANNLKVQDAGVKSLSTNEVLDRVQRGNLKAYWLGTISGAMYTFEVKSRSESALTYLVGGGDDLQDIALSKLIIRTFNSYGTYSRNLHPAISTNAETVVDYANYTLHLDSNFMQTATIVFKDSPQVVVINYPETHSQSSMVQDASALTLM